MPQLISFHPGNNRGSPTSSSELGPVGLFWVRLGLTGQEKKFEDLSLLIQEGSHSMF